MRKLAGTKSISRLRSLASRSGALMRVGAAAWLAAMIVLLSSAPAFAERLDATPSAGSAPSAVVTLAVLAEEKQGRDAIESRSGPPDRAPEHHPTDSAHDVADCPALNLPETPGPGRGGGDAREFSLHPEPPSRLDRPPRL